MRLILPLFVGVALALHIYLLYYYTGLTWDNALTDSLVSISIMALGIWGIVLIVKAYPTRVGSGLYALFIGTFFALLISYIQWQVLRLSIGKDDALYLQWFTNTMPARYIINWMFCGWIATSVALNKQLETTEHSFKQQTDATTLLKEAELYKLRQQLQPHFLYNSLNSISALTMIEPGKAQEMIAKLSDFLRSSVKREAQDLIPIKEELSYIEAYLSIEAIRFGDRLKIEFDKAYTDDAQIPPFLLQPVLENAIKFGLYGTRGQVTIKMQIYLQDAMLTISITNPYDKDSDMPRGTGFGLEGIRRRLYLLYARTDLLDTSKNDNIFTTTLKIPQAHV